LTKLIRINWKAELFTYERNEAAIHDAEKLDGKLFLLTSLKSAAFDAKTLVTRYKALADIERGFRTLKSELLIAPMHHRLERRLRAHALICFLSSIYSRIACCDRD
jgi:transposase